MGGTVDSASWGRENPTVAAGAFRREIALSLKSAYSDGLLSEDTFTRRLEEVLTAGLIDPRRVLGDLSGRRLLRWVRRTPGLAGLVRRIARHGESAETDPLLLALDWSGRTGELIVGRHYACDVVLANPSVSRHHACLVYHDGTWVLHDLQSTNGSAVNGVRVEHSVLHPGDDLVLGDERLRID
jgi:hypothetical protein